MLTSKSHVIPCRTYLDAFLPLCSAQRYARKIASRARKAYTRLLKHDKITAHVRAEAMRIVLRAPEELKHDVLAIESFKDKSKSELKADEDFMKLAKKAKTARYRVQSAFEALEKAASCANRLYKEVEAEKARKARFAEKQARFAKKQAIYETNLTNTTPSGPSRGVGKCVWNGKGVKIGDYE